MSLVKARIRSIDTHSHNPSVYVSIQDMSITPSVLKTLECPCCSSSLTAKRGKINVHHFAHIAGSTCPTIHAGGRWHLSWQALFHPTYTEVGITYSNGHKRVADIRTSNGHVIEIQHSPMSLDEMHAREDDHADMVWIMDGCDQAIPGPYGESLQRVESDRVQPLILGTSYMIARVKHKFWGMSKRCVFVDTVYGIFQVKGYIAPFVLLLQPWSTHDFMSQWPQHDMVKSVDEVTSEYADCMRECGLQATTSIDWPLWSILPSVDASMFVSAYVNMGNIRKCLELNRVKYLVHGLGVIIQPYSADVNVSSHNTRYPHCQTLRQQTDSEIQAELAAEIEAELEAQERARLRLQEQTRLRLEEQTRLRLEEKARIQQEEINREFVRQRRASRARNKSSETRTKSAITSKIIRNLPFNAHLQQKITKFFVVGSDVGILK